MSKLELVTSFIVGFASSFILINSTSGASGNEIFKCIGAAFIFGCIFVGEQKMSAEIEELKKEIEKLKNKEHFKIR